MEKKMNGKTTIFGMTQEDILSLADSRVEQKDTNHPKKSGSYTDFIKTAQAGRELLKKGSYCKNDDQHDSP